MGMSRFILSQLADTTVMRSRACTVGATEVGAAKAAVLTIGDGVAPGQVATWPKLVPPLVLPRLLPMNWGRDESAHGNARLKRGVAMMMQLMEIPMVVIMTMHTTNNKNIPRATTSPRRQPENMLSSSSSSHILSIIHTLRITRQTMHSSQHLNSLTLKTTSLMPTNQVHPRLMRTLRIPAKLAMASLGRLMKQEVKIPRIWCRHAPSSIEEPQPCEV